MLLRQAIHISPPQKLDASTNPICFQSDEIRQAVAALHLEHEQPSEQTAASKRRKIEGQSSADRLGQTITALYKSLEIEADADLAMLDGQRIL